jgi:hypothetical protein
LRRFNNLGDRLRSCRKIHFFVVVGWLERAKGIEPSYAAWEAAVLPLNYARIALARFI